MKIIMWLCILALFAGNVAAAERVDKELALEYLKISQYEEVVNASILEYEIRLFRDAKPEEKAMFHDLLVGSLGWDATKDQMATLVMNLYTKEEIDAAIAFMKSPAGASATAKSAEFSKLLTAAISGNMQKVLAKLSTLKQ